MAERLLLQNLLEMWPLELAWSLLSGVLEKTVHGVMPLHYNIAERVCQGKLLVVGYFWPPVTAGARSWRSCPHWRSCAQMQLPSAREAVHAAEVWRRTNQPALQSWVVGEPASRKSQMLVKTSLREPGTGEAASGACLENRLQPGRKTPPFWCLSSALYWQGLTSCWLRKENCLKGSDPFSQRGQKVHLELGSNQQSAQFPTMVIPPYTGIINTCPLPCTLGYSPEGKVTSPAHCRLGHVTCSGQ